MGNTNTDLDRIRAHIRKHGPAEMVRRTKLSLRTFNYLLVGKSPSFATYQKLVKDMERA